MFGESELIPRKLSRSKSAPANIRHGASPIATPSSLLLQQPALQGFAHRRETAAVYATRAELFQTLQMDRRWIAIMLIEFVRGES